MVGLSFTEGQSKRMPNFSVMKRSMLETLDDDVKQGIDALIEEARPYAENYKQNVWQLILILSKLETKYGQKTLFRWSEPLGIHWRTAYRWREIAKGITAEFVEKYGDKINIAKASILAQHYRLDLDTIPQEVLDYASSKDTTATSLAGYINEINTITQLEVEQLKEEAKYRVTEWAAKADLEPVERVQLEQLADESPELALSLTRELTDVNHYRNYVQQQDAYAQSKLLEYIERKAEPQLRRFLEKLEKDADRIKEAAKKDADTRKFKRELNDLINLLQEIDAVVPEIIELNEEDILDSGIEVE